MDLKGVLILQRFKADIAAQARKKAAARQKEAERKQVETMNRKHLAGMRVLQKNLVYIMGMAITGSDEELKTLRGPHHFGQYGEIVKIAANKAREGSQSAGLYVTFANKDDARDCIAALDGTAHTGRMLKSANSPGSVFWRLTVVPGLNTARPSTAQPSCATRLATIDTVPSFTRLGMTAIVSAGKISHL